MTVPSVKFLSQKEPLLKNTSSCPSNTDVLRGEILATVHVTTRDFVHAMPENNFWAISAFTLVIPQILKEYSRYTLPQSASIGPILNYVEAGSQGIEGLSQLFDEITHRPKVTRAKGIINLASSVQTIALTLTATALGPLGFAMGFGVSFMLSLDEAVRQMRRWHSAEYFLVDSLAELDKVELLIKKKQLEIEELELALPKPEKRNKLEKTAFALKKSTLQTLLTTRVKLQEQIEIKVDINRYENQQRGQISSLYEIIKRYEKVNIRTFECQAYMEKLQNKDVLQSEAYEAAKKKDTVIQTDCKKATKQAVSNSVLWALAFTGMLLTCIPGGQIPGVAIVAAVSVIYLLKNSKKVVDQGRKLQGFFKKLDEHHEDEGEGMPAESKITPPSSQG